MPRMEPEFQTCFSAAPTFPSPRRRNRDFMAQRRQSPQPCSKWVNSCDGVCCSPPPLGFCGSRMRKDVPPGHLIGDYRELSDLGVVMLGHSITHCSEDAPSKDSAR